MEIGGIVKVIGPRKGEGKSSEGIYWNPVMNKYIGGIYRIAYVSRHRYELESCVFGDDKPDIRQWVFSAEWLAKEDVSKLVEDMSSEIDTFLSEYD